MQLLFDMFDVNYNLPLQLQMYIFIFFLMSAFILIIQVRPMLDKLYTKTPFYWFLGLLTLNILNILITLFHYNWRSGTFYGQPGDNGPTGRTGKVGDYTKCTKCDETISLVINTNYDKLQELYINNEIGELRKPKPQNGFYSMGDMIIAKDEIKSVSLKQSHTVAGPTLKHPIDFVLVARIPKINSQNGTVNEPVYIWNQIPPDNYVSLGCVVTNNQSKPPLKSTVCIPVNCAKTVDVKDGFSSYRFMYQNMRPGQEEDYLFISFWETPINTFIVNFPGLGLDGERTFYNANLWYHVANGNLKYVNYDNKKDKHIPTNEFAKKIKTEFMKIVSPINLNGTRQNLSGTGYYKVGSSNKNDVISLWDAFIKHFPYGLDFKVSIDSEGDLAGLRPNNIQKKLIKYAQSWIIPNKSFYTLNNTCIAKTRIDYEKQDLIMKIKKYYAEFHYLLRKYGWEVPQLVDTLSSHFMRLKKQMRHIPNFDAKIREEDFNHFGVNRLKLFLTELKSINEAILYMTNEVPNEKRQVIFKLIRIIKKYDNAKMSFDEYIENKNCKHDKDKMLAVKKVFYEKWDNIKSLFTGDKDFKVKIKNRDFYGMSMDKITKLTNLLNDLVDSLNTHVKDNC